MPYAFDPTGILPANKVINDARTVAFASTENPYMLIPSAGPFYKEGFSLVTENGQTLEEGTHFYFTHRWQHAIENIGKEIYGSIILVAAPVNGQYFMNYQVVGANYPINPIGAPGYQITTEGFHALTVGQYFNLDWSNEDSIPATPHTHPLAGLEGMQQIYALLHQMKEAIESPEGLIQLDDIQDLGSTFITPVLNSLNEIMVLMGGGTGEGTAFDNINLKLAKVLPYNSINPELNFYSFPTAEFFKTITGKMEFIPGNEPASITFPSEFVNHCLHCDVKVYRTDGVEVVNHVVNFTKPTKEGIGSLSIIYPELGEEEAPDVEPRTLTYFAIGI